MSNMTIKEVGLLKAKAEREISEILTDLVFKTGATAISTSTRCLSSFTMADGKEFNVERFVITLEI